MIYKVVHDHVTGVNGLCYVKGQKVDGLNLHGVKELVAAKAIEPVEDVKK